MTEEEAKTRLCFRAATFAGSQQIAEGPGPFCLGSACMAWRADGGRAKVKYIPVEDPIPDGWTSGWAGGLTYEVDGRTCQLIRTKDIFPSGYCGLAGKP